MPAARPIASHLPVLDGLRAIAVLLVLWAHVHPDLQPRWLLATRFAFDPGMQGVDLFFVLSGFLITRILLAERAQGLPLRAFMLRRVVRIFPIYYLLLAVVWIARGGAELPWCAVYLSNVYYYLYGGGGPLEHTWSLCVEEHFYLLWPPIVAFARRRAVLWVLALAALLAFATAAAVLATQSEPERIFCGLAYLSPVRSLSLSAGCLLALFEARLLAAPRRCCAIGGLCLALGIAATPRALVPLLSSAGRADLIAPNLAPAAGLVSALLVSLGAMLACAAAGDRWPLRALGWAPLRAIGRISYGLYLYHLPIFGWMYARPSAGALFGSLLLAFAAATASYLLLERPLLRWARRRPPDGRRTATS